MRPRHSLLLCLLAAVILVTLAQEDAAQEAWVEQELVVDLMREQEPVTRPEMPSMPPEELEQEPMPPPEEPEQEPPPPPEEPKEEPPPPPSPPPPPPPAKEPPVLAVGGAEADVISASGKKLSRKKADFGGTLLGGVSLDTGASVEVTFTPTLDGVAAKPQQAMVLLQPEEYAGLSAYAVAKARKDGGHTATLSAALVEKQLGPVGGQLSATLLLGDPSALKGVRWVLGSIRLPETGEPPSPAYKTALMQPMNNLLPNIEHIFRPPDKRPAAAVSLVFTALAVAPLALLVLFLAGTGGLALPNFPSGAAGVWALVFHVGIGSVLVLYWLFWTQLNLAQTLPAALGLGLATAVAGYKALGALADARLQRERAGATPAKKTN